MRTIEVLEFVKINADPNNMLDTDRVLVSFIYKEREYRMIVPYNNENLNVPTQVELVLRKAVNRIDDTSKINKQKLDNLTNTLRGVYTLPNR